MLELFAGLCVFGESGVGNVDGCGKLFDALGARRSLLELCVLLGRCWGF